MYDAYGVCLYVDFILLPYYMLLLIIWMVSNFE